MADTPIFLSEFAIRFEYVSFAGETQCCPKLPHLGVGQHHLRANISATT